MILKVLGISFPDLGTLYLVLRTILLLDTYYLILDTPSRFLRLATSYLLLLNFECPTLSEE